MSTTYDFIAIEEKWKAIWRNSQVYEWNKNDENVFSIDTPPPTVSGSLHMGHIFSYTQTDFIARYHRMKGKNVFYPMGFDNNGLPTERLVEKVCNIKSTTMDRNDFINICQQIIPQYIEEFKNLFNAIGLSVDWNQEYQTISAHAQKMSQMSFLDLYHKKYIVRQKASVFWDAVDKTAIAQAEIEDKEQKGIMYFIRFLINDHDNIIIATTRPELIPACVCIFVHPTDERYQKYIGQVVTTPLFNKKVNILADENVIPEKGSGAVMCCTFGDIQDVFWMQKYNLPVIECITPSGTMKNADFLNDMYVKAARLTIVNRLIEEQCIIKQEEVIQQVKCAERSGAPLEILFTNQWFIKVMDYKNDILNQSNKCNWYPEYMKYRLENWINGLNQDWCISRQRHFGIPFPVWYSKRPEEFGKILLPSIEQLPVDPIKDLPYGYTIDEVIPEIDVMDTWATSAISPQISSCHISNEYSIDLNKHKKIFPFDLRPQAHEIIRIWAFGTIVKSMYHENTIPWKNLMISGWCLANDKSKMSKSKGNVIDPVNLIHIQGADVVRYWASVSKLGNDIIMSDDAFKIGRKLILKLINAITFFKTHLINLQATLTTLSQAISSNLISESLDLWAISHLQDTILKVEKEMNEFEYSNARSIIENYFWNILCDNYLELIKDRLYKEHQYANGQSAIITLYFIFNILLKLFAPFLPYITEELYHSIYNNDKSIHACGSWPKVITINHLYDRNEGDATVNILKTIRKFKSENGLSLGATIQTIKIPVQLSTSAIKDLLCASRATQVIIDTTIDNTIITI